MVQKNIKSYSTNLFSIFLSIILGIFLIFYPFSTSAILWISDQGSGGNPCVRQATAPAEATTCSDLQVAASSSTNGETMYSSGTFSTSTPWAYVLTLKNAQTNTTWTEWPGSGGWTIDASNSNGINVSGPTTFPPPPDAGATDVTISNVTISNATSYAIQTGSEDLTLQNISFSNNANSIFKSDGGGLLVTQCNFSSAGTSHIEIQNEGADPDRITRNTISSADNAIWVIGGNLLIDNNEIKDNQDYGIYINLSTNAVNIINNTIHDNSLSSMNSADIEVTASASDVSIINNLFNPVSNTTIGAVRVANTPTVLDYNDYWLEGGSAELGTWMGTPYSTLASWQTNTSQDANSTDVDPSVASNWHLLAGSPMINAGTDVTGYNLGIYNLGIDFDGDVRPSGGGWDIGFDEYEEDEPAIPEFSIMTLIFALIGGLGVVMLMRKINTSTSRI